MALLCIWSRELCFEGALWHQHSSNIKACTVCEERLIENGCHDSFTSSTCSSIHYNYDDVLKGTDDLSVTQKREHHEGLGFTCHVLMGQH